MKYNLLLSLILTFAYLPESFSQILQIEKINCRVSQSDLQTIRTIAKFEKDLYNNLFNTRRNDSLIIKVTIMGASEYKETQHEKASGLHKTWGFYTPNLDECFVLKNAEYLQTAIHEISHCLLHHNLRNPPTWLHEGIAEFCGSMLIEEDKVSFAANPYRIKVVKDMVTKSPLRLKNFMALKDGEWSDLDKQSDLYSISYSIIYFLIKKNPSILKRILLAMNEGQSATEAIEYNYGGFYKFEYDFNTFYKNSLIKPI